MTTMDELFEKYLNQIEPTEEAVARASDSHNPLREDLEKDEKFGPFVDSSMLSGSYGRDTSIFTIKDVDVILKTTFTKEDLRERKWSSETEQQCLLRLTRAAIERTGRTANTKPARRSIYIELEEDEDNDMPALTMDIVPVLIQNRSDTDPMTISDRELGEWHDTYPNTQLSDSIERNKRSTKIGGRHSYKPLVKIFKAWKQVHFYAGPDKPKSPKGFILECLTAKYHNPSAEHWLDAVHDLFANICEEWPDPDNLPTEPDVPEVPDVSDSAPHLIPIAKTRSEAKKILRTIHRHLELIEQAQAEAEDDLTKAAKTLRRVFGDDCDEICFPLPEDLDEAQQSKSNVREAPPFA